MGNTLTVKKKWGKFSGMQEVAMTPSRRKHNLQVILLWLYTIQKGRRDRMVVGFITTCAIGAYHH